MSLWHGTARAPLHAAGVVDLVQGVAAAFAADGPRPAARPGLRPRPGQLEMALAVAQTLQAGEHLAVEAGTGVGKTFAYLVPVLLSGQRALLSTATQALQDQLFTRDIPAVSRALGLPVRAALLKGRSSYLCLNRLELARTVGSTAQRDPAMAAGLEQVQRWARLTRSGDVGELDGLDERSPLRPLITSTRHNCVGTTCPQAAACHVNLARRQASEADWVVINHHLFFADQVIRETEAVDWLPETGVVVLDEAHQLNDTGVQLLSRSIASDHLRDLARELGVQGQAWARGLRPWAHLALNLDQACRALGSVHRDTATRSRSAWNNATPVGLAPDVWLQAVSGLDQALTAALEAVSATAQSAAELARLLDRIKTLQSTWSHLAPGGPSPVDATSVRWMEWGADRSWRMVRAPLDSAARFSRLVPGSGAAARSWIFASATLGHDDTLDWFTRGLGLADHPTLRTLRVASPFDHGEQASLFVPHDLPEPSDAAHTPVLAARVAQWATRLGGRTLVLTTTLRAASRMAEALNEEVLQGRCAPVQVLAQGRLSRAALLARFRAAASIGHGAILVASASFWEGVDLAGDALQLLVIDKLPFSSPDDPLMAARAERLEAQGLKAFGDAYLPEAAMALKQGAGRLIRTETDRGVLVIGDRRLLTRSYGLQLLGSLPPMRRVVDEADMGAALDALVLTRSSTRARPCS
ncbi:ATP-dependent DNA helicase [Hydrogenophaga sp.]|uniref:ATP-dependent DNA helicase n=1 Tax=Hydrogenophaga sp. TaxID=1904254 RepID=UPI00272F0791|nr:ATP-dependent DNA helicase [Hydrogenophaga sp.]MDP2076129.1 ATP-dependent DNA helicase [Hydrogenophaga sp.]MDP3107149.1 ATP-dependent DNA helicase [Hydrogenophaga sp.]